MLACSKARYPKLYLLKRVWWKAALSRRISLKDSWLFGFVSLPVSFPHFLLLMENLKLFKLSVTLPGGCSAAWSLHPCVSPPLLGELRNGRPPGHLKSRNSGSLKVVIKGTAGWWAGKWDLCWWNWEQTGARIALWQLLFLFFSLFYCIVHIPIVVPEVELEREDFFPFFTFVSAPIVVARNLEGS